MKLIFTLAGIFVVGLVLIISPFVYEGIRSGLQARALAHCSDCPAIAATALTLALSITNSDPDILRTSDPRVPASFRSLGVKKGFVQPDEIRLEFHGGFDHYGYRLARTPNITNQWTLYFYTEQSQTILTAVSE